MTSLDNDNNQAAFYSVTRNPHHMNKYVYLLQNGIKVAI